MTAQKNKQGSEIVKSRSVFGIIETSEVIFNPRPTYNIRNDCQLGQWKRGESELKGNFLNVSLLHAKNFYGELGKSRSNWLQLWFVGIPSEDKLPRNTVCCTYLKTRSLDDLSGKMVDLMTQEKDPGTLVFSASFEKHSGDMGNYFSVSWKEREREGQEELDQLELIYQFMQEKPTFVDTSKPATLVCTNGMTQESIDSLDATIDAVKESIAEAKS